LVTLWAGNIPIDVKKKTNDYMKEHILNCALRKIWRLHVLFVQDLLNNQGNYLSPQEFSDKYNIKVNFLQYYQITSAIPAYLRSYASAHSDLGDLNSICENFDFQLSKDITHIGWTVSKTIIKSQDNSISSCCTEYLSLINNLIDLE